jgi:hypothetical protein
MNLHHFDSNHIEIESVVHDDEVLSINKDIIRNFINKNRPEGD